VIENLTSSTKKIDISLIKDPRIKRKANEFMSVLDNISNIDNDKKLLWQQIYENAIVDREHARLLHDDLREKIAEDQVHHATFGQQITKYLERMSKSNDQLLKLAELIASAQKDSEAIDTSSVFDKIASND